MKTNKKLVNVTLGILFLSSMTVFANNMDPIKKMNDNDNPKVVADETPMELNEDYLNEVHKNASQDEAEFLSGIVAEWDVRQVPEFNVRNKPFTTVFKSNKGLAEVTYDRQGRVISAQKRFNNVVLPEQVKLIIFKRYEDWVIVKNRYYVSYELGSDVDKMYMITVQHGDKKKVIKVNA